MDEVKSLFNKCYRKFSYLSKLQFIYLNETPPFGNNIMQLRETFHHTIIDVGGVITEHFKKDKVSYLRWS